MVPRLFHRSIEPSCQIPQITRRRQSVPRPTRVQRGRPAALEVIVFAVPKSLYFAGAAARRMQTINSDDIRPRVFASLRPCGRRRQLFCLTSLMTWSSPSPTCPLLLPQRKCDFRVGTVNLFWPSAQAFCCSVWAWNYYCNNSGLQIFRVSIAGDTQA